MPPDPTPSPIDPKGFADAVRTLLTDDVLRYRNFGAYWYFVKALLRRYYDRHDLPFLAGSYEDGSVNDRIPPGLDLQGMLGAASAEYAANAAFNLGRNTVEDDDGERFRLLDPDVEA